MADHSGPHFRNRPFRSGIHYRKTGFIVYESQYYSCETFMECGDGSGRSREELQAAWRGRVNRAREWYKHRVAICVELQAERLLAYRMPSLPDPDGTLGLNQALRAERDALKELTRVTR